ncbi:MAG: cation:proton antiporter [Verrucomicrobiae bacterium]|nr:cation:proton antiporter [Verrucomicrobiae bacterium]
MHGVNFIWDFATVLLVAGVVTVVFHRFKQPIVLGYILAGIIIGPYTMPFELVSDETTIKILSDMGLVFLMFSLGLHFNLGKIKEIGMSAGVAAVVEIPLMMAVGFMTGRLMGWDQMDCLFLGAIISISSTTITVKALRETGKSRERFAEVIFGILIMEDILAMAILVLLSGVAATGTLDTMAVTETVIGLAIFLTAVLVLGLIAIPPLIRFVVGFKSPEMLLITVLGLCFGVCLVTLRMGYSVALGAFLVGAIVAESEEVQRIIALVDPLRDLFCAIFFIAIGLQIDPGIIPRYAAPICLVCVAVVAGKVMACSLGALLGGNNLKTSLHAGLGLAQIGEFSFIIAGLGVSLKATNEPLYPIGVAVSALTTLFAPYLLKGSDRVVAWAEGKTPRSVQEGIGEYGKWFQGLSQKQEGDVVRRLFRLLLGKLVLNVTLLSAVYWAASYVDTLLVSWTLRLPAWMHGTGPVVWFAATLLALPLLAPTWRILNSLGMVVVEMGAPGESLPDVDARVRAFVSNGVFIIGFLLLFGWIFFLSNDLQPSKLIQLVVLIALAACSSWFDKIFLRIYLEAERIVFRKGHQNTKS